MSTDDWDSRGHLKTSRATAPGDSGSGAFDFYSGKLVGVMLGCEHYSLDIAPYGRYASRGHILPLDILAGKFKNF